MIHTMNTRSSNVNTVRKTDFLRHVPVAFFAVAMSLTSCVKNDLYDTPHPNEGAVVVTTDWSGKSTEADIPQTYTLRIGEKEQAVSAATNVINALLAPGSYGLTAYNTPAGISINGNTATVDGISDVTRAASSIEPQPDYLFASYQEINVTADDTLRVTVPMRQLVRSLNLELTATEGDYNRVQSATATLDGVATAVDITTGALADTPAQTTTAFTQDGGTFTLHFRLLGIVPTAVQTLTVSILFTDGDTQTVVSDLTEQLAGFNSGDTQTVPVKLTGDLRLPIEAGFSATITDWQQGNSGGEDVGIK